MRTSVLVSGIVLLAFAGAAAGYYGGDVTGPTTIHEVGKPTPLSGRTAEPPLPKKTPEPSPVAPLTAGELNFHTQNFTIHDDSGSPLGMAIRIPRGWQLTRDPKMPREVKFLDPLKERAVRVESALPPPAMSTTDSMTQLVANLKSSQPYENDLRILAQTDEQLETNGETRTVSTLTYTYIPKKTLRYVIVRWIATGGDDQATVEMSITGLPQDAAALRALLLETSRSVHQTG